MSELRQNFFTKEWVIIATELRQAPRGDGHTSPEAGRAGPRGKLPLLPGQRK